jgi:hypothetical protein
MYNILVHKSLPKKTQILINNYKNLSIGSRSIQCPYYQNIKGAKGRAVLLGKGSPSDIERETLNFFKSRNKDISKLSDSAIRHYMVMANIGIDCSGFVTNILKELLLNKELGNIGDHLKPEDNSIINMARFILRPIVNLSAKDLTSSINTIAVSLHDIQPGDLLKVGVNHVALVTDVYYKDKTTVNRISYAHSTSDYQDAHGVRFGDIEITNKDKGLEKQNWLEIYRNKNWMKKDYLEAKNKRGIRRLKSFIS